MKKMKKMIAAAIVFLVVSTNTNAQAFATATATATIITPISITKNVDMNFGNLTVQNTAGGVVTLDPSLAATRTASSGGGVSLPALAGTVSAAKFTVNGQANYTYDISLPVSATLANSGNNMIADNFTCSVGATAGALNAAGTESFYVGADLNVNAAQAPGVYVSSAFMVVVNYN